MKYLGLVLFSAFGVFCAYWGVVFVIRGEFLTGLPVLAFGVSWFGMVAMGIRTSRGRVTARTAFDTAGTTIRPDRVVDQLSLFVLAAGVVSVALFAVLAPAGPLAIPIPRVQRFALPVVAAITALMGAVMLWRTICQGSLSYLRLTPSGFEFGGGLSTKRADWSAVKGGHRHAARRSQPDGQRDRRQDARSQGLHSGVDRVIHGRRGCAPRHGQVLLATPRSTIGTHDWGSVDQIEPQRISR
jgi:hypothetical protein